MRLWRHVAHRLDEIVQIARHPALTFAVVWFDVFFQRRAASLNRLAQIWSVNMIERDAPHWSGRASVIGNQGMNLVLTTGIRFHVTQHRHQDGEGCQALLAVDDKIPTRSLLHQHDRADKVIFGVLTCISKIGKQRLRFGIFPGIAALVGRHRHLRAIAQKISKGTFLGAKTLCHLF